MELYIGLPVSLSQRKVVIKIPVGHRAHTKIISAVFVTVMADEGTLSHW